MITVQSRLNVLIAEKETRDKRRYSITDIVEATDASYSTVQRLLNNKIKRVPLDELAKICKWLGVEPGDVLKMVEVQS
jgi:DNA-binding Xre family transcriptional regulator